MNNGYPRYALGLSGKVIVYWFAEAEGADAPAISHQNGCPEVDIFNFSLLERSIHAWGRGRRGSALVTRKLKGLRGGSPAE